jgi:hypothetical protein
MLPTYALRLRMRLLMTTITMLDYWEMHTMKISSSPAFGFGYAGRK